MDKSRKAPAGAKKAARLPSGGGEAGEPRLELTNADAVRQWLLDAHVGVEDLVAVTRDQLKPVRERRLGVREAKRLYREARKKLAALFACALGPIDDGGEVGGDPAGSGGSPAD
jgi:hypothetical protein